MNVDSIVCSEFSATCDSIDDRSVDMVMADMPYEVTESQWDVLIPFNLMWEKYNRIIKPHGAMVFTGCQPFTAMLICSNLKMYRHEWVWDKSLKTGHFEAKRRPMMIHESVIVFSQKEVNYYPQMSPRKPRNIYAGVDRSTVYKGKRPEGLNVDGTGYPSTILDFPAPRVLWGKGERLHPNEKPVDLFAYLIRTYTQPGELVFDPCCGSGTTAVAARREGRHWICGDSDEGYVKIANYRMQNSDPYQDTTLATGAVQRSLWGG